MIDRDTKLFKSLRIQNLLILRDRLIIEKKNKKIEDYKVRFVNQDLLNTFNTRPNERLMMPGFGFGGWNYLFEPIDEVRNLIVSEAEQVIANDPRVQLQNINVVQQDNGISIQMNLYYVSWQAYGTFQVNFDNRSAAMA